jgi:hypothetical protein
MPASAGPINKDSEITAESTGEILCAECVFKMIEVHAPAEETGPEAERLIAFITQSVVKRTNLPASTFILKCKPFADTDVSIQVKGDHYEMTWYYFIKDNPEQLKKAIDYVVNWINEHPVNQNKILPDKENFVPLNGKKKFVFFFIPSNIQALPPELARKIITDLVPSAKPHESEWRVWTVPDGSDAEKRSFMATIVAQWANAQHKPHEVLLDHKGVAFTNGSTMTCIIGYLKG